MNTSIKQHPLKILGVAALLGAASVSAHADGFVCKTKNGDLKVKAYNHVRAENGTRVGSVLVISDPAIALGNQTIARFTEANGTLNSQGASYQGEVDLRIADTGRSGEFISGTRLGQLERVILDVDYAYSEPVAAGADIDGTLTLVKTNQEVIVRKLECKRYLKN